MAGLLDLFGKSKDERDMNYTLGLLSAAAGALQGNTTPQALGGALQGGLGFTNQLQQQRALAQKMAEQKRVNDARIGLMGAQTDALRKPVAKPTNIMRNAVAAGLTPGTKPYGDFVKRAQLGQDKTLSAKEQIIGKVLRGEPLNDGEKKAWSMVRPETRENISDVVVPILRKMAKGEPLEKGEQQVVATWQRAGFFGFLTNLIQGGGGTEAQSAPQSAPRKSLSDF